jgi:hypothetical protein
MSGYKRSPKSGAIRHRAAQIKTPPPGKPNAMWDRTGYTETLGILALPNPVAPVVMGNGSVTTESSGVTELGAHRPALSLQSETRCLFRSSRKPMEIRNPRRRERNEPTMSEGKEGVGTGYELPICFLGIQYSSERLKTHRRWTKKRLK